MDATNRKHESRTRVLVRVVFCIFALGLSAGLGCVRSESTGNNGNSNSANDNSVDGDTNNDNDGTDNDNGGTDNDGGSTTAPRVHREAGTPCPTQRGPGDFFASFQEDCASDSECSAGANGRCMAPLGGAAVNQCTYDTCYSDADCDNAACDCRSAPGSSDPNRCLTGNCRVDSDCGPRGYCSPSVAFDRVNSPYAGYYCRTTEDTCLNDEDCAPETARCAFDPASGHWACSNSQFLPP